jgi:SAM-dependent methyltransferase
MKNSTSTIQRTPEQLREHYHLEIKLADRLRNSSRQEREEKNLYVTVYNELFDTIKHHPQLIRKASKEQRERSVGWQMGILKKFLSPTGVFVEIGAGDCAVSFECCKYVKNVIAIDVSNTISGTETQPDNFKLIQTSGTDLPLDPDSVDLIYSNQLIEHLHPDDAVDQLVTVYQSLKSGGHAVFITPNRAGGPWDISCFCDEEARGLHLKEYTLKDLVKLFSSVGFKNIKAYVGARGRYIRFPIWPIMLLESVLLRLPYKIRIKIARFSIMRPLLGIKLVGEK